MAPAVREKVKRSHLAGERSKPAIWQDVMVEVRETFRRVERVKPSGFTLWSKQEERIVRRGGPTLSRNRRARIRSQANLGSFDLPPSTVKELQRNRSQQPSVTFNHLQNLLGMCRRINAQSSVTERRKNAHDPALYPVYIRRPMLLLGGGGGGGGGGGPSWSQPSSARALSNNCNALKLYTKRQTSSATASPRTKNLDPPYSYAPRRVSLLLDISNRPSSLGPPPAFVPRPPSTATRALYATPRPHSPRPPPPPPPRGAKPPKLPYPPLLDARRIPPSSPPTTATAASDRTFDRSTRGHAATSSPSCNRPISPPPPYLRRLNSHDRIQPRPPSRCQHERPKHPHTSSGATSSLDGGGTASLTTPRSTPDCDDSTVIHSTSASGGPSKAAAESPSLVSLSTLIQPESSDAMTAAESVSKRAKRGRDRCRSRNPGDGDADDDADGDGDGGSSSRRSNVSEQRSTSFGALLMSSCCSSSCGGGATSSPSSSSPSEVSTISAATSPANSNSNSRPNRKHGSRPSSRADDAMAIRESQGDSELADSCHGDPPPALIKATRIVGFCEAPIPSSPDTVSIPGRDSGSELDSESEAGVGKPGSDAEIKVSKPGSESEAEVHEHHRQQGSVTGSESSRRTQCQELGSGSGSESSRSTQRREIGSGSGSESSRRMQRRELGSGSGSESSRRTERRELGSGSGSESSRRMQRRGLGSGSGSGSSQKTEHRGLGPGSGSESSRTTRQRELGSGSGSESSRRTDRREVGSGSSQRMRVTKSGDERGGVVVIQYSADAYTDFKESMMNLIAKEKLEEGREEEQVEEILQCYLMVNPPIYHGLLNDVMSHIKAELGIIQSSTH